MVSFSNRQQSACVVKMGVNHVQAKLALASVAYARKIIKVIRTASVAPIKDSGLSLSFDREYLEDVMLAQFFAISASTRLIHALGVQPTTNSEIIHANAQASKVATDVKVVI